MYLRVRAIIHRYERAASWYQQVLIHDIINKSALIFLGVYNHQIGNFKEAIYYLNEIIIYDKKEEYFFLVGLSYQYSGILYIYMHKYIGVYG
jgi:tetratricopeptide (TPR) repeat protein